MISAAGTLLPDSTTFRSTLQPGQAMDKRRSRRQFLHAVLAGGTAAAVSVPAWAQQRADTVHVLCGYPPGGSVDVVSRRVAERLGKGYAKAAIVENKPGAGGRLAVDALKALSADGSALLVTPASVVTMYPHIYRPLSYDVFADLTPVAIVAATEFCLAVGPAVPASVQTLETFADWCKANPAQSNCGNAGAGSFPHFMALLLARETGISLNHVPYRGGSAAMLALTGGQVSAALATEGSALALEHSGKVRVLATTATRRSIFFPKAPSFNELGYRHLAQREWFGAFMPRQAPAVAVASVADEISAMLAEADVRDLWGRMGLIPTGSSPAELKTTLRQEHDFWAPIIKASGFTPET